MWNFIAELKQFFIAGGGGIQCMEEPFLLALTSIEKVVVKEFMV